MPRGLRLLFLTTSSALFAACSEAPQTEAFQHLGNEVFTQEQEYQGPLETVGDLTSAYTETTIALRKANNKIGTLCLAALRCVAGGK